jgi:alpha-tubulin suppressor-like RCC1 family protein
LGAGDTVSRATPINITALHNKIIEDVSCGNHIFFSIGGQVYGNGYNARGSLGLGDMEQRLVPTLIPTLNGTIRTVKAGKFHSMAIMNDTLYGFGYADVSLLSIHIQLGMLGLGEDTSDRLLPVPIPFFANRTVDQVYCGGYHTLVTTVDLEMFVFGYNNVLNHLFKV